MFVYCQCIIVLSDLSGESHDLIRACVEHDGQEGQASGLQQRHQAEGDGGK